MKVFIVVTGIYEDYQVRDVFSSEEKAEGYIKKYDLEDDYGAVEEFTVDSGEGMISWLRKVKDFKSK